MGVEQLTSRERTVLEAVIQTYVETAEPAGSRTLSRRFGLGVSPATIRNTMSDLEEKGFLAHPHTSAGRIPTNKAYRAFVDALLARGSTAVVDQTRLAEEIGRADSPIEIILRRAAQSLGVLAQELGVALGPTLGRTVLRSLDLVRVSGERLLMVLQLEGGVARTVFVEVQGEIAQSVLAEVTAVLNERLAGLTLEEIGTSVGARLRDTVSGAGARELLNIFVQDAGSLFAARLPLAEGPVVLGQASVLADQPEFSEADRMRRLLDLTQSPQSLADAIRARPKAQGISITIGHEHADPRLEDFTVVTAEYRAGALAGVIGVIGPTRMSYDKVIALVSHTSQLLTELLD
ncbi:MAG: heat-inducible transcription repressor HrcA [Gemmatimonadota bacterium]|nr:heat-inducible transcription repressor HrcA [Gemmatimonadota bacterium]MDE3172683.1 heat-inducible transcription repressor HrcA [Gemmatimonadota bacterium]MDE3217063.1 heat-inducible transcription repressor HrcA [Gemmatimonadota bacterium]